MEEEEELYREMNKEDAFYMGNREESSDQEFYKEPKTDQKGCALIILFALSIGIASTYLLTKI